jgi:hypothetical protein
MTLRKLFEPLIDVHGASTSTASIIRVRSASDNLIPMKRDPVRE